MSRLTVPLNGRAISDSPCTAIDGGVSGSESMLPERKVLNCVAARLSLMLASGSAVATHEMPRSYRAVPKRSARIARNTRANISRAPQKEQDACRLAGTPQRKPRALAAMTLRIVAPIGRAELLLGRGPEEFFRNRTLETGRSSQRPILAQHLIELVAPGPHARSTPQKARRGRARLHEA